MEQCSCMFMIRDDLRFLAIQALNIYIALLERRRLLVTVLRTSAEISAANAEADANLSKVIAAMVPHTPTLAAVLSTSHSTALLVRTGVLTMRCALQILVMLADDLSLTCMSEQTSLLLSQILHETLQRIILERLPG